MLKDFASPEFTIILHKIKTHFQVMAALMF